MEERLMLGTKTRKIELELYGKTLQLEVLKPTKKELVLTPLQYEKKSKRQQIDFTWQLGLKHLVSVQGLGFEGKALVTEQAEPGYRQDWRKILANDEVGVKIGLHVASTLFGLGENKGAPEPDEEEYDQDPEEDDLPPEGETGAARNRTGGENG